MVLRLGRAGRATAALFAGLCLRDGAENLRISELVNAQLGAIDLDAHDDTWLRVTGKGRKAGRVMLPPLARAGLDRHLVQRGLP